MEELKHRLRVAEAQARCAISMAQTEADLGVSSRLCLLSPGVAFTCGVIMSDGHTNARGSRTRSDGVPEVLAGKAGLVTELFLDPGRGWLQWVQSWIEVFNVGSCFCGVDLPEQLVVLGQALRTTRRARLDLSKESGVKF